MKNNLNMLIATYFHISYVVYQIQKISKANMFSLWKGPGINESNSDAHMCNKIGSG